MLPEIEGRHKILLQEMENKRIDYSKLRTLLTPQKDRQELCLFFDTTKIENAWYGKHVFEEYFPLIADCEGTCVFEGDLIVPDFYQRQMLGLLRNQIILLKDTTYKHSTQYYLIYLNNLSPQKASQIVDRIQQYDDCIGYADTTFMSRLKGVISTTVGQRYLIHKRLVVLPLQFDYQDGTNLVGYNFEAYSKRVVTIDDISYRSFLCYKIQREAFYLDKSDGLFSLCAVSRNAEDLGSYTIQVADEKFQYLLDNKSGSLAICGLKKSFPKMHS